MFQHNSRLTLSVLIVLTTVVLSANADISDDRNAYLLAVDVGETGSAAQVGPVLYGALFPWYGEKLVHDVVVLSAVQRDIAGRSVDGAVSVLGTETYEKLLVSSLIAVPFISNYRVDASEGDGYQADIAVSVILIQNGSLDKQITISLRGIGAGDSEHTAIRHAVSRIGTQFSRELIPFFIDQFRVVLAEVRHNEVIINAGLEEGMWPGLEFGIIEPRFQVDPEVSEYRNGILVIRQVDTHASIATVLYSANSSVVGARLQEKNRIGVETSVSAKGLINLSRATEDFSFLDAVRQSGGLISVRETLVRGLYTFRPFIGLDFPLGFNPEIRGSPDGGGLLANAYFGGEMNWYIGRYQISPMVAAGIALHLPFTADTAPTVSHAGGLAGANFQYLAAENLKLFIEAGLYGWFGVEGELLIIAVFMRELV